MLIRDNQYRKLLEELYLIGELKPGKTISTRNLKVIDHTKFTSWYRWIRSEDRYKSLDWIFEIFDKTKECLSSFEESERKGVILALKSARDGITTLLVTYNDDSDICSKVNTLLTEIHILISKSEPVYIPVWLKVSKDQPKDPIANNEEKLELD